MIALLAGGVAMAGVDVSECPLRPVEVRVGAVLSRTENPVPERGARAYRKVVRACRRDEPGPVSWERLSGDVDVHIARACAYLEARGDLVHAITDPSAKAPKARADGLCSVRSVDTNTELECSAYARYHRRVSEQEGWVGTLLEAWVAFGTRLAGSGTSYGPAPTENEKLLVQAVWRATARAVREEGP